MTVISVIATILLVLAALVLIATVLLQPGESNNLGAIAGGAATFFGKSNAQTMERHLDLSTKPPPGVSHVLSPLTAASH